MRLLFLWLTLLMSQTVMSAVEVRQFADANMEQRYHTLISELRCLVCQNQNLADSNAELAQDLRQQVYDMLRSGSSDKAIIDFMVQRYGDFVLYRPRLQASTLLLWFGPLILLLTALLLLLRAIKQRQQVHARHLSAAEQEKIRRLLDQNKDED